MADKIKAVSNEEIIASILTHKTLAEAAAAVGISLRTIYDRMHDIDFRIAYNDAKSEVIRGAVQSVNCHLTEAFETVAAIMNNTDNNPAVRLQAAQTIISQSSKICERLTISEINFHNGH